MSDTVSTTSGGAFEIGETDFLLDGQPFRVLAGAIHYFRVHPDQWADRIRKARLMGLNTIETYVAWNAHAPARGEFDTDRAARPRPGSSTWSPPRACTPSCGRARTSAPNGTTAGCPAWLFADPRVGVRRYEPLYMAAVAEYFAQLLPIVAPRQIDRGGPVILVQIENEYGAYGDDKGYLRAARGANRAGGITVPLTTVDQPHRRRCSHDGSLPELHKTGIVRLARHRAAGGAAPPPADRAADVRRVLGRLVRPLGRAPPHHRRRRRRRRTRRPARRRRLA